ncbi:hypothetical protein QJQ45_021142 [Haematococcus lacustris]|nr:hypothetical protein QJQ45_021142 [Haematococcus lacustris]
MVGVTNQQAFISYAWISISNPSHCILSHCELSVELCFDKMAGETPRVNFEAMQRYHGRRVLLVGELKSSGNGCVTLRTSDDGEVTVLLNTASTEPWDAQYVEILGQVIDQRTVKEETHVNFGNNLGRRRQQPAAIPPLPAHCISMSIVLGAGTRRDANSSTQQAAPKTRLLPGLARLVVLGTGWGGARLLHDIKPQLYDLTVISTRNHMVFTPLLASTTVGTLDPRSVAVHITDIQKALFWPQNSLYIAEATAVLPDKKVVQARSDDGVMFEVAYDKLVVATGSQGSTFGIPGVLEHTHFLRDVHQAESIRLRLVDNIAKAGIPGRPLAEWQRLLHIVIVGGGPTGVEVAGELTDFVNEDLRRLYPDRARAMRWVGLWGVSKVGAWQVHLNSITLVEAREVLGSFDPSLREYAARKLVQRGVQLRKGVVKTVTAQEITLTDGAVLPFGLCIWSTGVGPTPFIQSLPFAKTSHGRLAVDSQLRVLAASTAVPDSPPTPTAGSSFVQTATSKQDIKASHRGLADTAMNMLTDESRLGKAEAHLVPDVYALGDCCATPDNPLPALAQAREPCGQPHLRQTLAGQRLWVAEQQGRYLAKELNAQAQATLHAATKRPAGHQTSTPTPAPAASASASHKSDAFVYKPLGSMATVGGYSAIMELSRKGLTGLPAVCLVPSPPRLPAVCCPLSKAASPLSIAGWVSWFAWRSAYLTRLGSISKRLLVAFNWASTLVFGRDMSRW